MDPGHKARDDNGELVMRTLLSWSTGKDSAWALHKLRQRADVEVVGLFTTVNDN